MKMRYSIGPKCNPKLFDSATETTSDAIKTV